MAKNETEKLEPIDAGRCQCEWKGGSFMTFGPRSTVRCDEKPTWVGFDVRDGQFYGAMSLCDDHKKVCEKKMLTVKYQPLIASKEQAK